MKALRFFMTVLVVAAAWDAAVAQWVPITVTQVGAGAGAVYNLNWVPDPACPACTEFDVIQGDLDLLLAGAGAFAPTVMACLVDSAVASPFAPLPIPLPATAFYFLVRTETPPPFPPGICGSWNADFGVPPGAQPLSRDPGLGASPITCPCPP